MEYWTKDKLDEELKKAEAAIDSINRVISDLTIKLAIHKGRIDYLKDMTAGQTKINFDENDTNQY